MIRKGIREIIQAGVWAGVSEITLPKESEPLTFILRPDISREDFLRIATKLGWSERLAGEQFDALFLLDDPSFTAGFQYHPEYKLWTLASVKILER